MMLKMLLLPLLLALRRRTRTRVQLIRLLRAVCQRPPSFNNSAAAPPAYFVLCCTTTRTSIVMLYLRCADTRAENADVHLEKTQLRVCVIKLHCMIA